MWMEPASRLWSIPILTEPDGPVLVPIRVPACGAVQRQKVDGIAPSAQVAGTAFTQVQNVVPLATQPIFSAYDATGTPVDISTTITDPTKLAQIKSVQITVTTQGLGNDSDVHNTIQVSMTGMARLVNN